LTATFTGAGSSGVLFDDDFGSLQRSTADGWNFGPSGSGANLWAPYVQTISETQPSKFFYSFPNGDYQDFGALLDVQPTGPGYAAYGLLFRWSSSSDGSNAVGYQFDVTTLGTYELDKQVGGQWADPSPVPPTPSSYIKTGNQRNVLGVIARGTAISLYINGALVNTVRDSSASKGMVGIFAATQDQSSAPPALVSFYRMRIFTAARAAADWGNGVTNPAGLAAGSPTPTPGVLFQDDFSSQQVSQALGWEFNSYNGATSAWAPGAMVMTETNSTSYDANFLNGPYDNFGAETSAGPTGANYAEYGVVFRASSGSNGFTGYVFGISSDGRFWLSKSVNGSWEGQLLPNAASSAIKQGAAQNVLRVLANGPQIRLFINGTLVGTATDSSLTSGGVGFYIAAEDAPPAVVAYHGLRILTSSEASADWHLPPEPAGTPAVP
jgi:hypothetical protein